MKPPELAPTLGPFVADWIADNAIHGPGEVMGEPAMLSEDHLGFLYRLFELRPDGSRKYRRACFSRAKGSAKTEMAAWIALVEAFGPARCAGFDTDGEPVPTRAKSPDVMTLATEEGQAGLCYSVIYLNLTEGPLAATPGLDAGRTRVYLPDGGVIRAGSAGAASKDGMRPSLLIADETHLMTLRELKEMHATAWRGIFKRPNALLLETTTSFRPGEGSIAEAAMETYKNLDAAGSDRLGVLYDHRGASCEFAALDDPDVRMAALLEAYGSAASYMPLDELVAVYDAPDTDKVQWARYWANMVVTAADSFIDPAAWGRVVDATRCLHDGDLITLGLDTSLIDDGTALVACRVGDGHVQRLGYWQKPSGNAGVDWSVPYHEVDAAVRSAFDIYRPTRLYADPQYVHSYLDQWSLDFGAKKIVSWPTNRAIPMSAALQRFFVAVKVGEGISHDGDTLLAAHVGNARTWLSQGRILVRKEYKHSSKKIDALIAAVLAFEAAADSRAAAEDVETIPARRRAWSF